MNESEAALSEAPDGDRPLGPDAPPERFTDLHDLGVGGVGRVVLVHDRTLGRDVARKQGVTHGVAHLLRREALITARLEHPGIVPIYDLGWSPERGTTFTMRVVRGRSLAEVLRGAPDPSLLRKLLAAIEAVAYAHERGVVHRDLKPHNIMLGDHGEVQVIDWGLAKVPPDWLDDLTHTTGIGTPRYMSPEQARNDPIDARADVWSLGAILYEAIVGTPTIVVAGAREALAAVAAGPAIAVPPTVPSELAAIITRAMARDPHDRYAHAGALADDLARYLDGRRVAAHAYSTWALFRRLVRAWRVPLAIIAGIVAIAVVAVVLAFVRVSREEASARHNLALALVGAAERHAERDERPAAETLAVEALARFGQGDVAGTARARGVLARFSASPRPTRTHLASFACADPDIADRVLCRDAEHIAVYDLDGTLQWRRAIVQRDARFFDGGRHVAAIGTLGELTVLDHAGQPVTHLAAARCLIRFAQRSDGAAFLAHSSDCLARFDVHGTTEGIVPCSNGFHAAALSDDDQTFYALCDDGTLVSGDPAAGPQRRVATTLAAPTFEATLLRDTGSGLIVGSTTGELVELGYDGVVGRRLSDPTFGMLRSVTLAPALGIVSGDRAAPRLFDRATFAWLVRLPDHRAHNFVGDTLVTLGPQGTADLERWTDLTALTPTSRDLGSGVAGLWLDGDRVAVAHADTVTLLTPELAVVTRARWQSRTVKAGAFVDGVFYAHGLGDPRVVAIADDRPALRGTDLRRLVPLPDGTLLGADFGHGLFVIDPRDGELTHAADIAFVDLVAAGDHVFGLGDVDRTIYAITPGPTLSLTPVGSDPRAIAIAVAPTGDVFSVRDDGVVDLATNLRYPSPGTVTAAVTTRWVAAGGADGSVHVWRRGDVRPYATMALHTRRVGALRLGGDHLYSGGWDGHVHRVDLGHLDVAAPPWGLDLSEMLETAD